MNLEEYNVDSLREIVRELQAENEDLRRQLHQQKIPTAESHAFISKRREDLYDPDQGGRIQHPFITREMLDLFYKVFQGRPDVYAKRGRKGGYYPQCTNRWNNICPIQRGESGFCLKNQCPQRSWDPLKGKYLLGHLLGKSEYGDDAIGLYPLYADDTCRFLVFDFDNHTKGAEQADYANVGNQWMDEVDALRLMCRNNGIDALTERSRSGRGAHIWIFFAGKVKASVARAFGYGLLDRGAKSINLISFQYYDRMYPSQDCSDSIGNLIALPLQGQPLKDGNSAFVDENWNAYPDQWECLRNIHRYTEQDLINKVAAWQQEDSSDAGGAYAVIALGKGRLRPWENNRKFRKSDVTGQMHLVLSDGIYIDALNLKPGIQNQIRCLAAFSNPKYHENKALGHSNYATPSVQYLGKDIDGYIRIPRGLLSIIQKKCVEANIRIDIRNERSIGRPVKVEFSKDLYMQQDIAAQRLLQFDDGILSAATAFGKTAVCSYLIASRKVSTLILLRSKTLLNQWIEELNKFLVINEDLPKYRTPTGRIKTRDSVIGTMKGGGNKLTGIIDIAMVDSLSTQEDLRDLLKNYGMVIMDECHHGASAGAQKVLDAVPCKYVYGVSATPIRGDHLEKINYMLLGPVRATYTAKERAADQGIDHLIRPRFTRVADTLGRDAGINERYALLRDSKIRNEQIIRDIRTCIDYGRTVAVLTRYKEHAKYLSDHMQGSADHVLLLYGDNTEQENTRIEKELTQYPDTESIILIATGQKIGEGFNFPRLNTLILGTPISDPSLVEQYVGRLNRDYPGKKNVVVYDYVDSHIYSFDNMYRKRLKTYKKIGYRIASDMDLRQLDMRTGAGNSENIRGNILGGDIHVNSIYDAGNYMEVFERDILEAKKNIVIGSPQLDQAKVDRFIKATSPEIENGVRIKVIILEPLIAKYDNEEHIRFMMWQMKNAGINVIATEEYGNHYAVIDDELVWHGGMNLLGKEDVWDNLMRTRDPEAAQELLLMAQDAEQDNNDTT